MKSANIQVGDLIIVEKVSGVPAAVSVCVRKCDAVATSSQILTRSECIWETHRMCGLFASLSNSSAGGEKAPSRETHTHYVFKVYVCWLARKPADEHRC